MEATTIRVSVSNAKLLNKIKANNEFKTIDDAITSLIKQHHNNLKGNK